MPVEEQKLPVFQFDRELLAAILTKIDPGLSKETLTSLVKAAGSNEEAAIKALFGQINQLILGGSATVAQADLEAMVKAIETVGASGKLVSLASLDSASIAALASTDIGARYALIHGLPFAITGNAALYDDLNRDGSLFKFDPNTGEKAYTDEWLKDRSQFLAVKFNAGGETSLTVSGTQSWAFEERTDGGNTRIQVNADQSQRAAGKMTFATGTTETQTIVGSASGDRIYSGSGDDNITTGAGDDYVEGGAGGDMIDGGRGNDTLLGGQGDDQLDGSVGDDKLFGGAGADYLIGGKGNDRIDGGNGFDTYVIDSGEGADTIVDADGLGEIVLDGQTLTGPAAFIDGVYKSADGKLTYSFLGDPDEGGVLVINSESGSLKLTNFKNGALGITLGDGSSAALLTGVDTRETLDLWGGNRIIDLPFRKAIDQLGPTVPENQGGASVNPIAISNALPAANIEASASIESNRLIASGSGVPASAALAGHFEDLFADPNVNVTLLTGEHVNTAIELRRPPANSATASVDAGSSATSAFGITATFLNPIDFYNDAGIHPRQIEYALMDFHNAISISGMLGGDNLGDASSIGVGSLAIGASFDSKQLSDDKYTDLGSKKIGVKG